MNFHHNYGFKDAKPGHNLLRKGVGRVCGGVCKGKKYMNGIYRGGIGIGSKVFILFRRDNMLMKKAKGREAEPLGWGVEFNRHQRMGNKQRREIVFERRGNTLHGGTTNWFAPFTVVLPFALMVVVVIVVV